MLFSLRGIRLVILTSLLSGGLLVMTETQAVSLANEQTKKENEADTEKSVPTETEIIQICVDKTGVDGGAMAAFLAPCVAGYERQYRDILAADYRRALPKVAAPDKLREAQQQWLKHKELTCAFEGQQDSYPSVREYLAVRCLLRLTLQRIEEIRPWIDRER